MKLKLILPQGLTCFGYDGWRKESWEIFIRRKKNQEDRVPSRLSLNVSILEGEKIVVGEKNSIKQRRSGVGA